MIWAPIAPPSLRAGRREKREERREKREETREKRQETREEMALEGYAGRWVSYAEADANPEVACGEMSAIVVAGQAGSRRYSQF